jgi:putative sterol carrier protein
MSDVLNQAVAALQDKLGGAGFGGSAKFAIDGEGSVLIDNAGARISDDPADVTLSADVDTFQEILSGTLNPTAAFMSGKLKVDGDMGMAMKLASVMA